MYVSDKDKKEFEILSESNLKTFDTPKKLNRSKFNIPLSVIEKIENHEVTSEMVSKLGKHFPIFNYKTCLTIHGNFDFDANVRIGGYKSIHKNKNNSLEVNWIAIDNERKQRLAKNAYAVDSWTKDFRSNKSQILKMESVSSEMEFTETLTRFKKIQSDIDAIEYLGKCVIRKGNVCGEVFLMLELTLLAIPSHSERALLRALTQLDDYALTLRLDEISQKENAENLAYEIERAERQAIREKCQAEKERFEQAIKHLPVFLDTVVGSIGIKATITFQDVVCYHWIKIVAKGKFGRYAYSHAYSLTLDVPSTFKDAKGTKKAFEFGGYYRFS